MLEPGFPDNEKLRIATLQNLNLLDTPSEERFDRLSRIAQQLFDVPIVLISLLDSERQWFKSSIGVEIKELPRSISFCGHAILSSEIFIIPDTSLDSRFADNPVVSGPPYVRFYAGQPLKATNGQIVGTFCILDKIPRDLDQNGIQRLRELAKLVEKELNARDLEDLTQKLMQSENSLIEAIERLKLEEHREKLRNSCLEMISRGLPLKQILNAIVESVEQQSPDRSCCILTIDDTTRSLEVVAAPSLPDYLVEALNGLSVEIGSGSSGTAAASGTRIIVEDVSTHPYWRSLKNVARKANINSCWSQPVINRDGDILGVISLAGHRNGKPGEDDILLIEQTANLIGIALERDLNTQLIQKQANFDALTGLPNRMMFRDRLNQELANAKRNNQQVALFFLDLDDFKVINDALGHDRGDQLLIEVARRLSGCMRNIDTVARFGGDEFTIVMGQLNETEHVSRVARELIEILEKPFPLDNQVGYVSCSIGISFYPDNARNADDLIKFADQAMYEAKKKGRNRFQYYSAKMQQKALARAAVLHDLRLALKKDQLRVYYQPIIDLKTGAIDKAEALLRWAHPHQGLIDPQEFISISEESSLIIEIGDWLLQQVIETLSEWRRQEHAEFQISVNTSSVQYRDAEKHLLKSLKQLNQRGLPGEALTIDISEKLVLEGRPETINQLTAFSSEGIRIALDDFGTGYSSLRCLSQYNFDYVKIDHRLISQIEEHPKSQALCEAIIAMAHKLDLEVIAEGVETDAQKNILVSAGCDFAQGYLFAAPLPAKDFQF